MEADGDSSAPEAVFEVGPKSDSDDKPPAGVYQALKEDALEEPISIWNEPHVTDTGAACFSGAVLEQERKPVQSQMCYHLDLSSAYDRVSLDVD